ncbi:hypothetical protein BBH99_07555 [Chryseobacterium contaminans]|uniref:DUF3828 domain-containing protein n=1 Tax=Chryseobacterium contaminans TaxID=1423959 RepID=A0A1M6YAJ3_9FLAO|nr:hypothetical protein [Chryseobacterium contaminans]OCA78719.1 hypothetical protein BBH99_07555 [Chryseobacterium contaminans]SHL15025.1 hypothetical protein SAMN05444407_102422 [Chryseobacterium contaminans]
MPGKPLLLSAACLLLIHCKKESTPNSIIVQDTIKQKSIGSVTEKNQDNTPIETVKTFLIWYRDNENNLSRFNTIKGGPQSENEPPANYSIDFEQVDKEISFLKNSNLLSEKFLATYRQNYMDGDEDFKKNPINDGPPQGFDYNYFFKTQDDYQSDLNQIEALNFTIKKVNSQLSHVDFHLKNCDMSYQYTLVKNNGDQWLIDSIENIDK